MSAEKYILPDRAAWIDVKKEPHWRIGCRSMCWEEPAQG